MINYKCQECGVLYKHKQSLRNHIKSSKHQSNYKTKVVIDENNGTYNEYIDNDTCSIISISNKDIDLEGFDVKEDNSAINKTILNNYLDNSTEDFYKMKETMTNLKSNDDKDKFIEYLLLSIKQIKENHKEEIQRLKEETDRLERMVNNYNKIIINMSCNNNKIPYVENKKPSSSNTIIKQINEVKEDEIKKEEVKKEEVKPDIYTEIVVEKVNLDIYNTPKMIEFSKMRDFNDILSFRILNADIDDIMVNNALKVCNDFNTNVMHNMIDYYVNLHPSKWIKFNKKIKRYIGWDDIKKKWVIITKDIISILFNRCIFDLKVKYDLVNFKEYIPIEIVTQNLHE